MSNKHNYFFPQLALPVADAALEAVYDKVWGCVAAKAVGEIAKGQVNKESAITVNAFVEFTFDRSNPVPRIAQEPEPAKIKLDEWAVSTIGIDERPTIESDKRTATIVTNSSTKHKKLVARKGFDQVSMGGSVKPKENAFVRVVDDPQSPEEEDKMRNKYLLDERVRIQSEIDRTKRQAFEKNQSEMKGKLSKDKKKITFDYDGKVMNLGKDAAPKKALMSTIGMNVSRDEEILKKVDKKRVESEKIERNTQSFKESKKPNKSELGTRVEFDLDGQKSIIEDDGALQNGVKVVELKGDRQLVKQNKPKNNNNPLRYRLQEFKDYIRERKFKEHAIKLADDFERPRVGQKQRNTDINLTADAIKLDKPEEPKRTKMDKQAEALPSINKNDSSVSNLFLPEIDLKATNQRSSKYFEEISKDKRKQRVKSVKIDNQHMLSSLYYKKERGSSRMRGKQLRSDSSNVSVNEPVYSQVFEI